MVEKMWTIKELKTNARAVLKQNYWQAFLVSLILALVNGFNFTWRSDSQGSHASNQPWSDWCSSIPTYFIALFATAAILVFLLALAYRVLLANPLQVGISKYFVEEQKFSFDLNHLGYSFNKTRYMDIVKAMLWRLFLNFLWFLLLIIPGIVALYAYRMVPYILADNPNIGYKRAVQLSVQMTRGHKFHIFGMDLSFIGWLLLGLIAFGVGVLFVLPYINATNAELYAVLKQNAITSGMANSDELPGPANPDLPPVNSL
ncbi:MAG TPA: DUF975 family protein [Syntrophomonas sp.]|nr:DUF975 family protein [Syntrophomonas sp.]